MFTQERSNLYFVVRGENVSHIGDVIKVIPFSACLRLAGSGVAGMRT